jgi:hypothetical protein
MKFNELVHNLLFPVLLNAGFEVVEELNNIIRFNSHNMEVRIVYNEYEKSNFIEIGRLGEMLYPLNDSVVTNIFNSELQISQVTPVVFVKNLGSLFTQKEGSEILKGNIKHLVKFMEQESSIYTSELIQRQTLETASKAWEKSDYKAFIKSIGEIGIEKLPQSYQLKYNIAKQKV